MKKIIILLLTVLNFAFAQDTTMFFTGKLPVNREDFFELTQYIEYSNQNLNTISSLKLSKEQLASENIDTTNIKYLSMIQQEEYGLEWFERLVRKNPQMSKNKVALWKLTLFPNYGLFDSIPKGDMQYYTYQEFDINADGKITTVEISRTVFLVTQDGGFYEK